MAFLRHPPVLISARFYLLGRVRVAGMLFAYMTAMICPCGDARVARGDPIANDQRQSEILVHVGDLEGRFDSDNSPFSGDSTSIVTVQAGFAQSVTTAWDLATCKEVSPPMRQKGLVILLQLTSDGKTLFTATSEDQVAIWDVKASKLRSLIDVGQNPLGDKFSPDGTRFITEDRNVDKRHLWRVGETKPFAELRHRHPVTFVAFDRSGTQIVTREWNAGESVHLWDAKTSAEICDPIGSDFDAEADVQVTAAFDASGKRLVVARQAGFSMVDTATGKVLSTGRAIGADQTDSVRFAADGSTVAVLMRSTVNGNVTCVQIFDSATGKFLRAIAQDTTYYEISNDGRWLIGGNLESTSTSVWELSNGSKAQTLVGIISPIALSPNGRLVAFSQKGKSSIWRLRESQTPSGVK